MSRFRNIVQASPMGIHMYRLEPEGRLIFEGANPAADALLGVDNSRFVGLTIEEAFPPLAETEVPGRYRRAAAEGIPWTTESIEYDHGEIAGAYEVHAFQTSPGAMAALFLDITKRRQAEQVMLQIEKMLSLGGLAAGMAHEINNPLAGMIQNAQVALDRLTGDHPGNHRSAEEQGIRPEQIRDYCTDRGVDRMLAAIVEAGQRAARIVEDMLRFSRQGSEQHEPFDLAELLDRTVELAHQDFDLKNRYGIREIEFQREYDPALPPVPCDDGQIQQVLLNLLRNGAQAMAEPGEVARRSRFVLRLARGDGVARIEVEDNGPGMRAEVRRRAFEPFFTTKEIGLGSGLGLSVSYFIITQNHAGRLSVESSPGEGARFVILLPLAGGDRG